MRLETPKMAGPHREIHAVEMGGDRPQPHPSAGQEVVGAEGEVNTVALLAQGSPGQPHPGRQVGDPPGPDHRGGIVAEVPGLDRRVIGEARCHGARPPIGELEHQRVGPDLAGGAGLEQPLAHHPHPAPAAAPQHGPAGQHHAVAVSLDEEHRDHPDPMGEGGAEQALELGEAPGFDPVRVGHEGIPRQPDPDLTDPRAGDRGKIRFHLHAIERMPEEGAAGAGLVVDADAELAAQKTKRSMPPPTWITCPVM